MQNSFVEAFLAVKREFGRTFLLGRLVADLALYKADLASRRDSVRTLQRIKQLDLAWYSLLRRSRVRV